MPATVVPLLQPMSPQPSVTLRFYSGVVLYAVALKRVKVRSLLGSQFCFSLLMDPGPVLSFVHCLKHLFSVLIVYGGNDKSGPCF